MQDLESEQSLVSLPRELLLQIANSLSDPDRKKLAFTCQELYGFVSKCYIRNGYGKLVSLNNFISRQLEILIKDIEDFKKSQSITLFNQKKATGIEKFSFIPGMIVFLLVIPIIGRIWFHFSNEDSALSSYNLRSIMINLLFIAAFSGLLIERIKGSNTRVLNASIDQFSIDALNILAAKNSILSQFDFSALLATNPTHQSVMVFLKQLVKTVRKSINELSSYRRSVIGTNISVVNFGEISEEKLNQEILINLANKWKSEQEFVEEVNNASQALVFRL